MHSWEDEWFQKYGDELDQAIRELEHRIRKWAKAGVCGKEKWGCYCDDFLTLWDGSLTTILYGYKASIGNGWLERLVAHIDYRLIPYKKTRFGWIKAGLANFNRLIGLVKLVNKWQCRMINKAFQVTCKEHPDIIDELVVDTMCYRVIRPCKWGDVDGEKIHKKYWKTTIY